MTEAVVQREFSEGLSDARDALDKLTGLSWTLEGLANAAADAQDETVEAARIGINGRASPRFLLVLSAPDAGHLAERVTAAFGLAIMDVPFVLAETANIIVSAILNKMSVLTEQMLIVTAPDPVRGTRGDLLETLMPRGGNAVRVRFSAKSAVAVRLDIIAVWDVNN